MNIVIWCILWTLSYIHIPSPTVGPLYKLFFWYSLFGDSEACWQWALDFVVKWCWQWPCIFGLGSNFVAAPIFWAGFWFCNGSRIQTHFVKNTRCWYMLLVFCRWGSNIYFHIKSDSFLLPIFLTRSGPHYKIRPPRQNQDQEPLFKSFKSQQQDQKSPNWASTKWWTSSLKLKSSSISDCCFPTKFYNDFVQQFREPDWCIWALCRELAGSEICWSVIL